MLAVRMSRDPEDIQGILNTLLVPMEPPNRSQWKKLELAMKFIKLSKQSVAGTKKVTKQEWNVGFNNNNNKTKDFPN